MIAVTYPSAKLGRVYGKGLFAAVWDRYPRWLLYPLMLGAFAGNVIEAAANMGGVGGALNLLVPLAVALLVVLVAIGVVLFQLFGSYAAPVDLPLADARVVRLCRGRSAGEARLDRGRQGDGRAERALVIRFSRDDRRVHRSLAVGLCLHLAIGSGGRGADRRRQDGREPTPGRKST